MCFKGVIFGSNMVSQGIRDRRGHWKSQNFNLKTTSRPTICFSNFVTNIPLWQNTALWNVRPCICIKLTHYKLVDLISERTKITYQNVRKQKCQKSKMSEYQNVTFLTVPKFFLTFWFPLRTLSGILVRNLSQSSNSPRRPILLNFWKILAMYIFT